MSTIQSDIILLDSRLKSSGTNQAAQYNLIATGGIGSGTYELMGYQSSNQIFNVEAGVNDTIYWAEPGNLNATVPPGSYTVVTFNAAAKIVMDAASGSTFTFTVAADTGRTTVAIAAGTFNWEWATNIALADLANSLLGHSAVDTGAAASIVGDEIPDLRSHTHILVTIAEEGSRNVTLVDGSEFSLLIPIVSAFGEDVEMRKQQDYQQSINFVSNVTTLNVSQFTEDGTALVNQPDYVLALRKLF